MSGFVPPPPSPTASTTVAAGPGAASGRPARRGLGHRAPTARLLLRLCLCTWTAAAGLSSSAWAGTEAEAEAVRLDEDLRKLASRNTWEGVDGVYARLRGLESKGVVVTREQHELGAEAARQLGRMREARGRYGLARSAARKEKEKERIGAIIADIDARYGSVSLTASGRSRRDATVQMTPQPFASDARAAIQHATDELQLSGSFDGLLPVGSYTFGSAVFAVTADGGITRADSAVAAVDQSPTSEPVAEVEPDPPPKPEKPEKPPRPDKAPRDSGSSGLAAYLGGGVGSATWTSKSDDPGYWVPGGTGAALRLVGGGELSLGPVGLVGELSWDGMFGSGGDKTLVNLGALAAGLSFGNSVKGRILGQLGVGRASIRGVDPIAACASDDLSGAAVSDFNTAQCEGWEAWSQVDSSTFVVSPGGFAGAVFAPEALGPVAITVDLGLRGVAGQLVPWTAVGAHMGFGG